MFDVARFLPLLETTIILLNKSNHISELFLQAQIWWDCHKFLLSRKVLASWPAIRLMTSQPNVCQSWWLHGCKTGNLAQLTWGHEADSIMAKTTAEELVIQKLNPWQEAVSLCDDSIGRGVAGFHDWANWKVSCKNNSPMTHLAKENMHTITTQRSCQVVQLVEIPFVLSGQTA